MGRKMGFSSLFRMRDTRPSSSSSVSSYTIYSSSSSWPWPSCKRHPMTKSFRAGDHDDVYKTVNSVYFDTSESWFTNSSEECESFSTASEDSRGAAESLERVVRGLRSDRLFFEPGCTSSILEESKAAPGGFPLKESVVQLEMESEDPYSDFRSSMEEVVVALGLMTDWDCLEELLEWYLRVNGKMTHGFIVGAFVDLLLELASVSSSSSSCSSSFGIIDRGGEGRR